MISILLAAEIGINGARPNIQWTKLDSKTTDYSELYIDSASIRKDGSISAGVFLYKFKPPITFDSGKKLYSVDYQSNFITIDCNTAKTNLFAVFIFGGKHLPTLETLPSLAYDYSTKPEVIPMTRYNPEYLALCTKAL